VQSVSFDFSVFPSTSTAGPAGTPTSTWVIIGVVVAVLGLATSVWKQFFADRPRLEPDHVLHLQISRLRPGEVEGAWLALLLRNTRGRDVTVENVGLDLPDGRQVEIPINKPVRVQLGGPVEKVYARLGPLLAAGVNPLQTPLRPWARTSARYWYGAPHTLIFGPVPYTSPEQVGRGLAKLATDAASEPSASVPHGLIVLRQEDPPRLED
jgi:hypothetical protein